MKVALCIGHNYAGTSNFLPDCELDATNLSNILSKSGYKVTTLKTCTINQLQRFALDNSNAEEMFLYYSGHGTQYPISLDIEPDGKQEAYCLWNGRNIELLSDKNLKAVINQFKGSITVVSDSCFSGGMTKLIGGLVKKSPNFRPKFIKYSPKMLSFRATEEEIRNPKEIAWLSACKDSEVSYSTGIGGAFTLELMDAIKTNITNYSDIVKLAKSNLVSQTPQYEGNTNKALTVEIEAPSTNDWQTDLKTKGRAIIPDLGTFKTYRSRNKWYVSYTMDTDLSQFLNS